MNIKKVPEAELTARMGRFVSAMDKECPEWEACAVCGGVNMYYFTGTICDGVLIVTRGGGAVLWVRKSYERAVSESGFGDIRQMSSFKDIALELNVSFDAIYLDMASATLEWYNLFCKYLPFKKPLPIDGVISGVRSIKSPFELDIMREAGSVADRVLREQLPAFFNAGMSEAELGADIFSLFIKNGYHGVSRFTMRNSDVVLGHIGFAESPLYPSVFNGASGLKGLCAASPVLGSRDVKLKDGDLIYIDAGFGMEGYNVDKTLIFSFRKKQPDHINAAHYHCLELERLAVSMMKPGAAPSDIYNKVMESVNPEYKEYFMGTKGRTVRFLGHGVGLYIDEAPVLAKGFDKPLECGMTIAVEPKMGIDGAGMVGSENTYLITESGTVSLTGTPQEIIIA